MTLNDLKFSYFKPLTKTQPFSRHREIDTKTKNRVTKTDMANDDMLLINDMILGIRKYHLDNI